MHVCSRETLLSDCAVKLTVYSGRAGRVQRLAVYSGMRWLHSVSVGTPTASLSSWVCVSQIWWCPVLLLSLCEFCACDCTLCV